MHQLLFYDVVPDYVERRAAFRSEHLALAQQAVDRGELVLGGALADPVDGAVLLFAGDSPAAAERFAAADPYVKNGIVTRWRVRPWNTVVHERPPVLGLRVAGAVFGLMGLAQLARLVVRPEIVVAGHALPLWPSALAVAFLWSLSFWMWRLSRR